MIREYTARVYVGGHEVAQEFPCSDPEYAYVWAAKEMSRRFPGKEIDVIVSTVIKVRRDDPDTRPLFANVGTGRTRL